MKTATTVTVSRIEYDIAIKNLHSILELGELNNFCDRRIREIIQTLETGERMVQS